MKIYTANKETGTFIDEFKSIEEAKKLSKSMKKQTKKMEHMNQTSMMLLMRIITHYKTKKEAEAHAEAIRKSQRG